MSFSRRFGRYMCGSLALAAVVSLAGVPGVRAQPTMIMAMGQAGGRPLDVVEVPLTLLTMEDQAGDPLRVAGLDLTLTWDAELAGLESVGLTEATETWILAANPAPGRVEVSMASLDVASATPTGLQVLTFRFELREMVGQTPLHLEDTRAFDVDQAFIEHVPVDGRLDVGVVPTTRTSLGRLKSLYAP